MTHFSLTPGTLLAGRYRVERLLGQGAMGTVVAARHLDLHELRALKLMHPALLADRDGVERFLREARAAVRLRSPHVCQVHDVARLDDGTPFIVMEHLIGEDLKNILETRGVLPPAEAVGVALQVCEALAEAHDVGIVHRDLKPANLFVTVGPGGVPWVKVLDFGIAKIMWADGPGVAEAIGTPVFMSPEQMRAAADVDARTDVWAMGVVLYRALSGRLPFAGSTVTQICTAVLTNDPPSLAAMGVPLPPGLEAVVRRCLEKEPGQRFQSAAELRAALLPYAAAITGSWPAVAGFPLASAGGTTSAHASLVAAAGPPDRGSRGLLVAGVIASLGLVAGVALLARALSGTPSRPVPAASASAAQVVASAPLPSASAPAPSASASAPPSPPSASASTQASAAPARPPPAQKPPRRLDAYGEERK